MTDTQLYSVFLIRGNTTDGAIFLFKFKQNPNLRPHKGDTISNPLTLERFKILRDEFIVHGPIRIDDNNITRITDDGKTRVIDQIFTIGGVTHSYFVTRANNPNRISSYSTSRFSNDQTLKQLFR